MRRAALPLAVTSVLALLCGALAPAAAADDGSTTRLTGVLQRAVVEHPDDPSAPDDVRTGLRVGSRFVPLPEGALPQHESGETVAVDVADAGGATERVVASRTLRAATATAVTTAPTVHRVYVAIVSPLGWSQAETPTPEAVKTLVGKASAYWSSQTGGAVTFAVAQVLPWYQSLHACSGPEGNTTYEMWNEALDRFGTDAAGDPVAYGVDKHLLVVTPDGSAFEDDCYYGYGTIGSLHAEGNATLVSDSSVSLYAHELGHNLGLNHANALHCTTSDAAYALTGTAPEQEATWPASCAAEAYGDLFDVMSYSGDGYGEGNLNAVHLHSMGLLPSSVRTVAPGLTSVRIAPLSAAATALRGVRVVDAQGNRYYVEYRTRSGLDTMTDRIPERPSLGVRVLRENPDPSTAGSGSYVLDATPTGVGVQNVQGWVDHDYDTALAVGRVFTSAARLVQVRVESADAYGATLTIGNGTALPAATPGRVALTGLPARVAVGTAVTATATVTTAAARPVAGWTVSLQRQERGSTAWSTVATALTTTTGAVPLRVTHGVGATYRLVTGASGGIPALTSAPVAVSSTALPRLNRPVTQLTAGRVLATSGSLPAVPGAVVHLQTRLGTGSWTTPVRATVRGTTVSAGVALTRRGSWSVRYRLLDGATGRWVGGYSATYPVKVV